MCTFVITVKDTGIGIPDELRECIFEQFSQADVSTTRKFGGTGLGLSISKQLVEMMGGSIDAISTVGQGSEFRMRFNLPFTEEILEDKDIDLSNVPILVVDDSELNRRIALEYLQSFRIPCDEAAGAAEAMEKLKQAKRSGNPFGIAVLDNFMVETDGGNLAGRIKTDPLIRDTVLILFSSGALATELDPVTDAHFSASVLKPIRILPFLQALSTSWKAFHKALPIKKTVKIGQKRKEQIVRVKTDILLVEDNAINKEVASGILQRYGCVVDMAENGKEALVFFKRKNYGAIFMDVHMPVMDGFEATRQIRQTEARLEQPATPIIAMTALAMKGDRERCHEAGMNDYIPKPLKSKAILDMLLKYCPGYLTEVVEDVMVREQTHENHAPPVLNPSQLLDITDYNAELIRELVDRFDMEAPILLNALQKAIESGDQQRILKTAHKLNGVAANCGGERFLKAGLKIEKAACEDKFDKQTIDISFLEKELDYLMQALKKNDWITACKAIDR